VLVYAKSSIQEEEKEEEEEGIFHQKIFEVHLTKKLVKCMELKTGHLGKLIRNNLKNFKWVLKRDGNDRLGR